MVNAVVKDKNETYSLMLTVGFRGSTLLRVNTNNQVQCLLKVIL